MADYTRFEFENYYIKVDKDFCGTVKYKNLSEIDRLSVVMLIDKIFIAEDKTIDVRFNHTEELSLIEEMANTDKTRVKNNIAEKKSTPTNRKLKTIHAIMNKNLVNAESEVCYG